MKKIYFLRTAQYNYLIPGLDLYDSFDAVATRESDVSIRQGIIFPFQNTFKITNIFCSPAKRSVQTAKLIGTPSLVKELSEVFYSMSDFISKEEFFKNGKPNIEKARRSFVKALIANKLKEPYSSVMERIEKILFTILPNFEDDCVFFSHGFFLKILEAYIRDNSIKSNPKRLLKYFSGDTETYHFLEGFILEYSTGEYRFKQYIRDKERR